MELHNLELQRDFNTKNRVEIESSEDFNLDQPYIIDFNETGYFYYNKKDRDEDFEKMKNYLSELENIMFN